MAEYKTTTTSEEESATTRLSQPDKMVQNSIKFQYEKSTTEEELAVQVAARLKANRSISLEEHYVGENIYMFASAVLLLTITVTLVIMGYTYDSRFEGSAKIEKAIVSIGGGEKGGKGDKCGKKK